MCPGGPDPSPTPPGSMRDLDVGALPICGNDSRLKGRSPTATSRHAASPTAATPVDTRLPSLAQGKPVTVGADDDIEVALRTMSATPRSAGCR